MLTNRPDKKRCATRSFGAYLAVAAFLAVGVHRAEASLLVYEPFDYTGGATVSGQEGGSGFTQGWWTLNGDSGTVRPGSLPSSAVPASGNSAGLNASFIGRPVDEIAGTADTQTWTSFLFSTAVSTVDSDYAACLVLSPVDGLDSAIWIGAFDNGTGQLYLGLGNFYNSPVDLSSIAVVPGETYLLTVSIDWNAGDTAETVRLYLNPPSGGAPAPGDAIATATDINIAPPATPGFSNRISSVYLAGLLAGEVAIDEIRIGESFADVVPVPEPSTAVLVAIALGVFARFRVRRA